MPEIAGRPTLIVAGGDVGGADWLRAQAAVASDIIGADGGAGHLWHAGIRPDLVIGDLDSLDEASAVAMRAAGVPFETWPTVKEATDLELAIEAAIIRGATALIIAGALATRRGDRPRLDHLFGNIGVLGHPALAGRPATFVAVDATVSLATGPATIELDGTVGDYVTLVALTDTAEGIVTTGLAYPLQHDALRWGSSRGVSNELASPRATVHVGTGRLLVVWQERLA